MATAHAGGLFLAFEGPEGSGKSTQVERLAARLVQEGFDPLVTREPGGPPAAERVRDVLLDPDLRIDPLPEFLLYSAARAQHVAETIAPALSAGRVVLTDRFVGSSLGYQGHGRGLDLDFVRDLSQRVTKGRMPDLTILLDLPPTLGLERARSRGAPDRLERADDAFHARVRAGLLDEAGRDPRWHVLDATRDADDLEAGVWALVAPRLGRPTAR